MGGFASLGKDPTGWLFGSPSSLYSNEVAEPFVMDQEPPKAAAAPAAAPAATDTAAAEAAAEADAAAAAEATAAADAAPAQEPLLLVHH